MPNYDVKGQTALPKIPMTTFQKLLLLAFDRYEIETDMPLENNVLFSVPPGKFNWYPKNRSLFRLVSEGSIEFNYIDENLIVQYKLDAAPIRGSAQGVALVCSCFIVYFAYASRSLAPLIGLIAPCLSITAYYIYRDNLRIQFANWLNSLQHKIAYEQKRFNIGEF